MVELILVRHGESVGNVAAAQAYASDDEVVQVDCRDADVPLSDTGVDQARALGDGLRALAAPPDVVWCSPYVRAQETARLALESAALDLPIRLDERLRDRELGVLDRLTMRGVRTRYPEEAERRRWLGKFYHRPPGGESWADVALRLRSLIPEMDRTAHGQRVLVVCHDAVVLLIRYICERLGEEDVLELTRGKSVLNVSITRLERVDEHVWTMRTFNDVSHLQDEPAPVTEHRGASDVRPE
ncbi:MAG: phosphoglycerate mutase family protein [uncultured Nocardioidaceae bacterium]|uniref:phosphoglycerate mutase (2,3-diphosphoglycerate-dependent) n=1 Tax=uncultured Nocardioidaceae bacterium TaxID=253824 RepID=A0A6J4L228_9ACTN|nr:MAG: phosphoglycerate mutase family protein [uncultured Nocardioidaceae bacterium]